MNEQETSIVVGALVQWAEQRAARQAQPRQNLRVLFASPAIALAVRSALEPRSDAGRWFVVRSSSDHDAVELRHGRPRLAMPAGVSTSTPLLYIVFWTPSVSGHANNAESLADLRGVSLEELLGDVEGLVLGAERAMEDRCKEASEAWAAHAAIAHAHLSCAWRALVRVLRTKGGGSLPFVTRLEDYAAFLRAATIDDASWEALLPDERAPRMVEAWGSALAELELFHIPELDSLLKLETDARVKPKPAKPPEARWLRELEGMLAEDLDVATDHTKLAEQLEGRNDTLEEQVERLTKSLPLSRSAPEAARADLLRFCREREITAFRTVPWLFRKDPKNLRSESWGLKGLLIARKTRNRKTALMRAAEATRALLEKVEGVDAEAVDDLLEWCSERVRSAASRPQRARELSEVWSSVGRGTVPALVVDAKARAPLEKAAGSEPSEAAYRTLAQLWEKLGGARGPAEVKASTLLFGVAQVLARSLEHAKGEAWLEIAGARPGEGESLELAVVPAKGAGERRFLLSPRALEKAEERERLRCWLRDAVFTSAAEDDEDEDDEQDDLEEADAEDDAEIAVDVRRVVGAERSLLGTVRLAWPKLVHEVVAKTLTDAPRAWRLDRGGEPLGSAPEARAVFHAGTSETVFDCPAAVNEAWRALYEAYGEGADPRAAIVGPAPEAARALLDAWLAALSLGEDPRSQQDLMREARALLQEGRTEEGAALLTRAMEGTPAPDKSAIRALLRAWTGSRWEAGEAGTLPSRIFLAPLHPLVLRLRLVAEDALADVIRTMWTKGWSPSAQRELDVALDAWGSPEPIHCYGGFYDGEPLVFDAWLGADSLCVFSRAGASDARDLPRLGVRSAVRAVSRYLELHPAAGDTLRIRVHGDAEACWAASLLEQCIAELSPDVRCDLEVVTDLDPRRPSGIDRAAIRRPEVARALEMDDDGNRPRFRHRRVPRPEGLAHLSLVLGPTVRVLQSKLIDVAAPASVSFSAGSRAVLFAGPTADAQDDALLIGAPRDEATRAVARAIPYGERRATGVYVERLSFDDSVIRPSVAALHEGAHWTVVVGRHPLHGAMQKAGTDVAILLDFAARAERGRPVWSCVSAGTQQFHGDLARLTALLREILGAADEPMARALVREARSLAPGLAMRCAATASTSALQGLLGLLLTRRQIEAEGEDVAISLDQHGELLAGSGRRGDILALRAEDGLVSLRVSEAKLFQGSAAPDGATLKAAQAQVQSSHELLAHLDIEHPLEGRTRELLLGALTQQAEMAGPGSRAARVAALLRDPSTRVLLEPPSQSVVHVWTLADGEAVDVADGASPRCVIHPRPDTLERLSAMLAPAAP